MLLVRAWALSLSWGEGRRSRTLWQWLSKAGECLRAAGTLCSASPGKGSEAPGVLEGDQ